MCTTLNCECLPLEATEGEEGSSFFANNCEERVSHLYSISRTRGTTYILEDLPAARAVGRFGTFHAIANGHELTIDVFHSGSNGIPDNLLNLPLDEASSERLESLVQEVMFRVTDRELQTVDFDDNFLDLEDGRLILVS